jgi:very-short-patch-repair endonuclease
MATKGDIPGCDELIARVAARQYGVVTRAQLLGAGLLSSGITLRVRAGRLHRIHRGVYAVGQPRLSAEGSWMAAVLACGSGAVLSHQSAAELWGMRRRIRRLSPAGEYGELAVHVTVPTTAGKRRRFGIVLHRSSSLKASECTRRNGIAVTTPARTLEDVRRVVSEHEFAAAVRETEFLGLPIGERVRSDHTRSELEARFLNLCRRHRIPKPEVNADVDGLIVDFLWRNRSLIVEVDGWESHRTRSAFEQDRARDARLKLLGYEVLRFTWLHVTGEARQVAGTIRTLLQMRHGSAA